MDKWTYFGREQPDIDFHGISFRIVGLERVAGS
jgi:hypothetical protein